jgi:hypothetical protein
MSGLAHTLCLCALVFATSMGTVAARAQEHERTPAPEKSARPLRVPEAIEMLGLLIAKGADMGPTDGWFHPSESRFDWRWLAHRFDLNHDGQITREEFRGAPDRLFLRLDRDRSGAVTADDLDWSESSEFLQRRAPVRRLSSMLDADTSGRITPEEWAGLYRTLSGEKGFLTGDDLADWIVPPPPPPNGSAPSANKPPSRLTLVQAFFASELGSLQEGPALGELAPDFTLWTHDRDHPISLADLKQSNKPIVLIFGSFT